MGTEGSVRLYIKLERRAEIYKRKNLFTASGNRKKYKKTMEEKRNEECDLPCLFKIRKSDEIVYAKQILLSNIVIKSGTKE